MPTLIMEDKFKKVANEGSIRKISKSKPIL